MLRCQCEYHLPFKELSPTTKVNLQCRLYCLSGSATVVLLDDNGHEQFKQFQPAHEFFFKNAIV